MVCCAVRWECDRSVPSWATINFRSLGWGWKGVIKHRSRPRNELPRKFIFFNGMKKSQKELEKKLPGCCLLEQDRKMLFGSE